MSVIEVEQFKAHIGVTDSSDTSQLVLDAAEEAIARRIGPLSSTTATYIVTSATTTLVLPHTRIIAVSDPTGCTVDKDSGVITLGTGFTAGQVVTYTYGFDTLPGDVRLAVLEMGRHLWQAGRGHPRPGTAPSGPALGGYAVPNAVAELIESYVDLGFA